MPGSSESPSNAPSKAKVTSATTNGGIFVRPVAVAGIFCPVVESDNKPPPALPEKRRFSALVGDLRPCSSATSAAVDDFNRRRQSWDIRQKESPFSQALLKKTPRKNTSTSTKSEDTKCDTEISSATVTFTSTNVTTSSSESPSLVPNLVPLNESFTNANDDKVKLKLFSNTEKKPATQKVSNDDTKKITVNGVTVDKNDVPDSKTALTSTSSVKTSTFSTNLEVKTAVENKHSKKVYGLIKRESNSDILNNQKNSGKSLKSENTNISADSKSEIADTQKTDKETKSKLNSKKEIDKKSASEKFDPQKECVTSNKEPEISVSKKVYGLNKNSLKKESTIRSEESQVKLRLLTGNLSFSSECNSELQEKQKTKTTENRQIEQSDITPSISPPKEFRTVRRTSDVIAAKIQNIFSNFQSDKANQTTSRKSVNLGKKEVSSALNSQFKKSDIEIKGNQFKDSPLKETSLKQAKTTTEAKQITKADSIIALNKSENKKNVELSAENKYCDESVGKNVLKANKNNSEIAVNNEKYRGTAQSNQKTEVINIQSLKVNTSPVVVTSKINCTNNPVSLQQQDKKVADIDGNMPTKKADQNNSGGANSSGVLTNGNIDRISSEPSASLKTVEENANKRSEVLKKQIMPGKNSVTDFGSSSSSKKSVMKVTSSSECRGNNIHQFESIESHSQSFTSANSQTGVVSDSFQRTSYSNSSTVSKEFNLNNNNSNGNAQTSAIEVTKITPTTVPGVVPTVNVLFRTKSPQNAPNREENRKKVVIETSTTNVPVSSAVIIPVISSAEDASYNCAKESVKEALKAVETVQKSLNSSPAVPKKHSILNLKNEELVTVSLASSLKETDSKFVNSSATIDILSGNNETNSPFSISSPVNKSYIESTAVSIPYKPELGSMCSMNNSSSPLTIGESNVHKSISSETKTSVVDLSEWSKKFQSSDLEAPRAPLRRRFLRDSLPPSLPSRSVSVTRYGSLKRIEDPPRYLPRSPSQSIIPQRYSYTEMLSKVCSMGVLPYTEPMNSKSCSSSSSQVSELWSELSEEQSTATHASEMLEAETSERMRLEKEVHELQNRYSQIQQRSDKMEMEMIENRMFRSPEINGDLSDEDATDGSSSIYKQKYERAVRDMEIMKRRMQQLQEEEMEQKAMMKKASEKRLAEALEDIEEERQVANQWKRKAQKLGAELQDLRLIQEEQTGRNGELEKKQRKFDAELSSALEEKKKERALRDKLMREKDQAISEKYTLEQELQSVKMDSDMLHEKISQLNRELDELTLSSKGEEEVTQLKRTKQELERKARDQEEELEELAAQVQMLEQAKLRLEMSLEKVRQEHRREASVREEEVEEIRASFSKKIKNLEAQLESEQDERHQLMKQKHELERRIYELADQPPPQDPEVERRLRRDLKRTKALLRDAQSMLEHTREGQSSKTLIRQLKNQLEDSEFAKTTAVKARQAIESELQECQLQLEEVTRVKNEAESRCLQLAREKSAIQTQLEEAEEEMAEVMKKYKAAVAQMSIDQKTLAEQNQQIAELESERQMLKDQLSEVSHKFEHLAGQSDDTHKVHWLDSKIRDLESKLELEQTTKTRLENQIARLKEQNDRSREECDSLRNKEMQAQEGVRRLQRQIRDLREDYAALQQKEADAYRKQHELEMALENTETDLQVTKNDLRLACQRIQDLQNALEDDLDSGTDVPDDSGSDSEDSFELSVLRNQSVTPVQRCESVASNLSYCTTEDIRSRTSSFSRELSAFSSRDDVEKDINGLSGVSSRGQSIETDETV